MLEIMVRIQNKGGDVTVANSQISRKNYGIVMKIVNYSIFRTQIKSVFEH